MDLLCKIRYYQFFIALLMITALYGKPLIFAAYDVIAGNYANSADTAEAPPEDGETEQDNTVKTGKKSYPEIESGELFPATSAQSSIHPLIHTHSHLVSISKLYQKVPTQPPLYRLA